jgi:hypothetical protein
MSVSDFLFHKELRDAFFRPLPQWGKRILGASVAYLALHSAFFIYHGIERTALLPDGTHAFVTRTNEIIRIISESEFRDVERHRVLWASSLALSMYWLAFLAFRYYRKREDGESNLRR